MDKVRVSKFAQTTTEFTIYLVLALILITITLAFFDERLLVVDNKDTVLEYAYVQAQPIEIQSITMSSSNVSFYITNHFTQNMTLNTVYFDSYVVFTGDLELKPDEYILLTNTSLNSSSNELLDGRVRINISFSAHANDQNSSFQYAIIQTVLNIE